MYFIGCVGEVEEVVKVVVFLSFDDVLFVVGVVLLVDGGYIVMQVVVLGWENLI